MTEGRRTIRWADEPGDPTVRPDGPLAVAAPENPPPPPPPATPSLRCAELAGFDPRLITDLPLATTLVCRRTDGGGALVVTTSAAAYAAARAAQLPVFVGGELWAMTLAAEHDRAWPSTVAEWCSSKTADPSWRLTEALAIGRVAEPTPPRGWRLEQVLRRLGLELEEVSCADELPEVLA